MEPNDATVLENADTLTVVPRGDVVACEDGSGIDTLVGTMPKGQFYKLGRNAMSESELAGAVFSPDESTLFMNLPTKASRWRLRGRGKKHRIGLRRPGTSDCGPGPEVIPCGGRPHWEHRDRVLPGGRCLYSSSSNR